MVTILHILLIKYEGIEIMVAGLCKIWGAKNNERPKVGNSINLYEISIITRDKPF